MKPILFHTTDWSALPVTEHAGEQGVAYWRTLQFEGLRIRLVQYSAGYKADHWCARGHVLYCLEGEMISELADGTSHALSKGMSYQVSDGVSAHRSRTDGGATLLIIDGEFLKYNKQAVFNPWKM